MAMTVEVVCRRPLRLHTVAKWN